MKESSKHKIIYFESLDSTNAWLMSQPDLLGWDRLAVFAGKQTKGRGRHDRVWESSTLGNLYTSIVIHAKIPVSQVPAYALVVGLSVFRVLEGLGVEDLSLKWPNDILAGGKKISGILCESRFDIAKNPVIVAGIGVNLINDQTEFAPEVQKISTSLEAQTSKKLAPQELLENLLDRLDEDLARLHQGKQIEIFEEWEAESNSIGQRVAFGDLSPGSTGRIKGLSPQGYLLVQTDMGAIKEVISGEVRFLTTP